MIEKQQKYVEEKKRDITNHKAEPQLISRTDEWNASVAGIIEFENEAFIEVNIPGVTKDDVEVKLRGNEIVITGYVVNGKDRDDDVHYREYDECIWHRYIVLSDNIDKDKISYVVAGGVLKIVLPKIQAYKQRQIDVKAGYSL